MARVTVEDCILKVPNRFDLVMLAAQRTREIGSGAALTVDRDNDKNAVVSLREIADETVSLGSLKESLIRSHQKVIEVEDEEEDIADLMEGEHEWAAVAQEARDSEHNLEGEGMHEEMADDLESEEGDEDEALEDEDLKDE